MGEQRYDATEGHLLAIGFWHRIGGLILLGVAGVMLALGLRYHPGEVASGGMVAVVLFLLVAGLIYQVGCLLQRFSDSARQALGLVQSILVLLALGGLFLASDDPWFFTGFLLNLGYSLGMAGVLFSRQAAEVCSAPYQDYLARNACPRGSMVASAYFWIPTIPVILVVLAVATAVLGAYRR